MDRCSFVHPVEDQGKLIITVDVRHSRSVTVPPLKSWVAAEKCGAIICSHCTCMAGLGGVCAHVTALLFAAEAYSRLKDTSCTLQPCAWLSPSMQNVAYAPISDINFTAAPTMERRRVQGGCEGLRNCVNNNKCMISS